MKKTVIFFFLMLTAVILTVAASAQIEIRFSPEVPRVGDVVDVKVTTDTENPLGITYALSTADGEVFTGEECSHYTASFRPRTEKPHTLTVTVRRGKKETETAEVSIPVSGFAPTEAGKNVLYSQKDGWWKDKKYSIRSLEKAGCAIFALSHALQRMGFEGEDVLPDRLAEQYANCYIKERGTANERLLTLAGEKYDFITQDDLNESEADIAACLRRGDRFSFSIVIGHIALADGISEDGTMVHIVDSAPGATYERIKNGRICWMDEEGSFRDAASPEELPGIRWYFESGEYGGMEYWMDLKYCARRGLRLIRPQWLKLQNGEELTGTTFEYAGALISKVMLNGEAVRVPTRDLRWTTANAESSLLALVTPKGGTAFQNADGRNISGFLKIKQGTMLPVIDLSGKSCYVFYKGVFGYVSRKNIDLLETVQEDFETGLISKNGKTAGTATVAVRAEASAKARQITEWKIGTPVAVVREDGDFLLVEGKGMRGWVKKEFITLEGRENDGKTVNEGK